MVVNRYRSFKSIVALAMLITSIVSACAKPSASGPASKSIAAPIHGVNYTGETFAFVVRDLQNSENYGGGEAINPYGAGGTMCCYSLPAKWKPGLKVEIAETYWLPMRPDESLPEFKKKHVVEVPAYQGSEVGALWVMRLPGGEINVISSDVQPDHPSWPGKIKGWPIPSLEYRRKLHDRLIKEAEATTDLYMRSIDELSKSPFKHASEEWNSNVALSPSRVKGYVGPNDPAYRAMLKKEYQNELAISREKVKILKEARP